MAVAELEGVAARRGTRADGIGYAALAGMILIGSSTATVAKTVVLDVPTGLIPLVRFGGAGLCLLPLALLRRGALARMARQDPWWLLASAAFCVPINQAFFLNGARLTSSSHVGLIYAAVPLVVLALAIALGQERPNRSRLKGVLASVAGVAVIALGSLLHSGPAGAGAAWGDLLEVGAVLAWGSYITVSKPLITRHGAFPALVGTFLLGCLLDLPIALLTMPSWPPLGAIPARAWWCLAYLTLAVGVVALSCQNIAMRRFEASQLASIGNLAPMLTVVWGVLIHGEAVGPTLILGGALTLGGVLWAVSARPAPMPAAA